MTETHDPTNIGTWTYSETVARGLYHRSQGGLYGKHDNVRTYWEDELTRMLLRPFVRERVVACAAANRRLRVVDLGSGAGQGYELLTRIRQTEVGLEEPQHYVVTPNLIECYLGLDISESMLERGRENYRDLVHVRFARADLREGLGSAAQERPFDLYFSSYGSLSHLRADELAACLRAVTRHAEPGAVVVLDLVGRHSPEWPGYWGAEREEEKFRPYSMSYLFPDDPRRSSDIERFPLRFWTGSELRQLAEQVSADTGTRLEVAELLDRSIFVGRHVDTREYGSAVPPLRAQVNRLYEQNVRTSLEGLLVHYRAVPGFEVLNRYFAELAEGWNTLIECARARLSGQRIDLTAMRGWRDFPAALQMALFTLDRIVDSVAWIDVGDVRANIIEPQLAYVLRRMQHRMQQGIGSGHGLVAVLRVGEPRAQA